MAKGVIRGSRVCRAGQGVKVGNDSLIAGRRVYVGPHTTIGRDVSIRADEIRIGSFCAIEDRVNMFLRDGVPRRLVLGDCCTVGNDCRVQVMDLACGDYVALHNHVLINGGSVCTIGHNSYVGQNCILNANRPVTIGTGVGMVAYSAVWTHGKFGEIIEGSKIRKEAPVVIEDDVTMWRTIVSPGVRVGRKATILNGSIITGDVSPGDVVAGVPARSMGGRITAYGSPSLQEKFSMMKDFIVEFLEASYQGEWTALGKGLYEARPRGGAPFTIIVKEVLTPADLKGGGVTMAVAMNMPEGAARNGRLTIFDVSTKTYVKRLTQPELRLMRFLLDARARFVPSTPASRRAAEEKKAPLVSRSRAKSFSATLRGRKTGP